MDNMDVDDMCNDDRFETTVMVYDKDWVNASCLKCRSIIPGYKVSEYSFCPYCGRKIRGETDG